MFLALGLVGKRWLLINKVPPSLNKGHLLQDKGCLFDSRWLVED